MLKLIFILTILSIFQKHAISINKISVHVLYESLCPDSLRFINEQLYPVWRELAPYVDIYFVPFGKSTSLEDGLTFVCQHGPKECLGNKIQSCALHALIDQNAQIEYVHCFMNVFKKNTNNIEMGQSCAEAVGIPWDYVQSCSNSLAGTQLQLKAEMITGQYRPNFIPTIIYNEHFNQQAQDDSQVNFRGVVCTFVEQSFPGACRTQTVVHI
ncbi:hypothetical protein RN001_002361 [Aquatica leii]|uniref:Gamma-interferon-inducible lysosomal thiol reductase n=1 Tax=Aquatica leii TaxID=1421715 RepID=A0AAN7PDB4_9COLE|nr:hypothetical protein RN001_002361 [Aquatica leii]